MQETQPGPFKRKPYNKKPNLRLNASCTTIALIVIAISQIPIGLKSSLEIICITNNKGTNPADLSWCKKS